MNCAMYDIYLTLHIMFLSSLGIDKDVIQINDGEDVQKVLKNIIGSLLQNHMHIHET